MIICNNTRLLSGTVSPLTEVEGTFSRNRKQIYDIKSTSYTQIALYLPLFTVVHQEYFNSNRPSTFSSGSNVETFKRKISVFNNWPCLLRL
jgi:hypothetical protein